jgi:hypothetical protein
MEDFLRKYLKWLVVEFQERKPSETEFLRAALLSISISGFGKCGISFSHHNAFQGILCLFEDWRQKTLNTVPSNQRLKSHVSNPATCSDSSLFVEFEARPLSF